MNKYFFYPVILLFFVVNLQAQKSPINIGKLDKSSAKIESCEFYPDAKAMYLVNYGTLKFRLEGNWKYEYNLYSRKKIFDITAADEANIKFRLYKPLRSEFREEMIGFKAFTYNMTNGDYKKEKVSSKDMFETRLNDYFVEMSIAVPNVVDGTVIDYHVTIMSDYLYTLQKWEFQTNLPVAHSEYKLTTPQWFNYQTDELGYMQPMETIDSEVSETFSSTTRVAAEGGFNNSKPQNHTASISSLSPSRKYIMKNVPPVIDEPYMNNATDVPGRLETQLVSVEFPNSNGTTFGNSYATLNERLMNDNAFGDRLNKGSFIKDKLGALTAEDGIGKANEILRHIQTHFSWNEGRGYASSKSSRAAYSDAIGNSAELNFALISTLREYGLEAHPIILNTRGRGAIKPAFPGYNDFNYVITALFVEGKMYLADGCSKLPIGQIPSYCRNGKGWLVKRGSGSFIDLMKSSKYNASATIHTTFSDGKIASAVNRSFTDYAAMSVYNELDELSEEKYVEELSKELNGKTINEFEITEAFSNSAGKYSYQISENLEEADIIYLQPIITGTLTENPFTQEERFSIVDFPYQQSYAVLSTIEIPDGYQVEIPESAVVKLPANKGRFIYNAKQEGDVLKIVSQIKIKATNFTVEEYPLLKQFYQMAIDKNAEPIVLKK